MNWLRIAVIVILVLCQGLKAVHVHASTVPSGPAAFSVAAPQSADEPCTECWACQSDAMGPPVLATGVVCLLALRLALAPTYLQQAFFAQAWPPRGPPAA